MAFSGAVSTVGPPCRAHRPDPGRAHRLTWHLRRVHAELTLGLGLAVGHNQVEMLMTRAARKGLPGNRRPRPRHETPTATDLVERMLTREAPNRLWVNDITEHRTYEGKV